MPESPKSDMRSLLDRAGKGDRLATEALFPLVYDELRELAGRHLRSESPGHTLQATALVHEAYLRLAGGEEVGWQNRAHFFGAAATAIRRILVEHSRQRQRLKRGGQFQRVLLDDSLGAVDGPDFDILALDETLERLSAIDQQKARVIELRFFGGLSVEETAAVLGVSERTVARDWRLARAWLRREMSQEEGAHD